jgi:hypothetical protein
VCGHPVHPIVPMFPLGWRATSLMGERAPVVTDIRVCHILPTPKSEARKHQRPPREGGRLHALLFEYLQPVVGAYTPWGSVEAPAAPPNVRATPW